MKGLRTTTANEARVYLDGNWRIKLNEIYDAVRAEWRLNESIRNISNY